ncbi:MAG TPA: DAK2 domain-containing protein [Solirubrobacterales bacterium]|nr:DAK2 domain-containing protein [Solirubrobacterales bacterium]
MPVDPSIERFGRVVSVAYEHLQERRRELNDLNVFPVADGDTGDNMAGTIEAVLRGLESLRASELAAVDRNYIIQTVAHSALMGARGNSGVILSQIVRGAAEVLTTRRGDLIGPTLVRDALERAASAAWDAVGDPQEGTMLTVISEVHRAVAAKVEELDLPASELTATEAAQDAMLAELLVAAIDAGQRAVERTPEQLDVLAEAGVVDAGAYGLVVILAGLVAGLAGQEAGPSPIPHQEAPALDRVLHADSRFQYCTSCIVTGRGLDPRTIAPLLEELGDSVAVVGDETMLKVHVHTDTPERAREICRGHGDVDQFEYTDMRAQIAQRGARLAGADGVRTGVVAVASGAGIAQLFGAEGARVVDGGPTLNPPIEELVAAIEDSPGDEVIVLPNSPNVVMAAEEAVRLADRPARVVDTASQQAGLVALTGAFDASQDGEENASRLVAELESIATGLVAEADRDDADGRYRRGEAVGFAGAELVAWGDPAATLGTVVSRLAGDAEIVTVLEGSGAPLSAAEQPFELAGGAEVEVLAGGQPTYWWLIAAQ